MASSVASPDSDTPERMWRLGRPADQEFAPNEPLYLRCRREQTNGDRLRPEAVRFPNFSVNRGKYSKPDDVLISPWSGWGIATFNAADIPADQLRTDEKTSYRVAIDHVPLEENYAHSEVRTLKNGVYDQATDVPKTLKKEFRLRLCEKIRVTRAPKI